MRSALVQTAAPGLHVFRKWMSERVAQQGCLPAGQLCFALLGEAGAGRPWMQGRELGEDLVFVLRAGQDFMLQRPQGMELLACSFADEDFRRLLDTRPWSAAARALLARPAVQAPSPALARLRSALRAPQPMAAAVFAALADTFEAAAGPAQRAGSASAAYIVAECHRLVAGSGDTPPDIDALARHLHTSRRSLLSGFRQVADTTAVHYLRSVRLNAARQRLLQTRAAELSVSDAAGDAGFEHLGHFGERYRQLFGELPSQTTRRTPP
jgi:AraC-like DNA-binding protein